MKNLPLGISTLSKLLENNCVYVDKTEYAYNLTSQSGVFFLSRPRRFGKSLFVDTLKEIFEGNQKLFEGLYIYNKWDWTKKYPVIKLDFAEGMLKSRKDLDETQSQLMRSQLGGALEPITGGGEGGTKGGKKGAADKAAKEAAQLAEEAKRQAAAASDALFAEQQRFLILQQTNPIAKAFTQYASQELVIQRELNQALKDAKGEKEKADLRETARLKQSANALELEQEMKRVREDALAPIEDLLKGQREQLRYEKDVTDLLQQGMLPERAKQVAEVRKMVRAQLESLDLSIANAKAAITEAEARGANAEQVERLKKALEDLEKARGSIKDKGKEAEAGVPAIKTEAKSPLDYIKEGAASAQEELAKLTNWGYQAVEAGKAIGAAFGTAFKDLISGSASAQEALASMMQSIANHFLDMAAQIIAQQITMMIYGTILKAPYRDWEIGRAHV